MRAPLLKLLAILGGIGGLAAADEPYPYVVHVKGESSPLRSGPGEEYYETSRLVQGTGVEVWRDVPGGWLAVRPPRGSFSLVSAADVRVRPDRVAEVVRPDAPAHVGSELTSQRDVVQVLLAPGERVQVLETLSVAGEFWHKIAPPSGEFRWIHETHVAGAKKVSGTFSTQSPTERVAEGVADTLSSDGKDRPYRIARHSVAAGSSGPKPVPPAREDAPRTPADGAPDARGTSAGESAVTSAEIELELATIVAEDPGLWQFAHLKSRCQDLLSPSAPASRRREVEALLEKMSRFERIRDKKLALLGTRPTGTHAASDVPPSRHEAADPTPVAWRAAREDVVQPPGGPISAGGDVVRIPDRPMEAAEKPGRYDGIGTLRPVVSRRREAPRYALVDPDGDVVTFITPSPGVNLQPYVGQRIGVVGTRGYMPEFKRTHVTAARVTPLR